VELIQNFQTVSKNEFSEIELLSPLYGISHNGEDSGRAPGRGGARTCHSR
jgi:hypothetical protein